MQYPTGESIESSWIPVHVEREVLIAQVVEFLILNSELQIPDFQMASPLVGVIMGSKSDWDTMRHADELLTRFGVPHECRVVSAHRTPAVMAEYATGAAGRGLEVIIAGAGGAAHLPGMVAAQTVVPVIGVPVQSAALHGLDSLLSIVQMPQGVPVATVAIGAAGAANAGLLAIAILANSRPELRAKLQAYRDEIAADVRKLEL
jgi:5-(carboxyamino)imidazole ribonucleotide mutase